MVVSPRSGRGDLGSNPSPATVFHIIYSSFIMRSVNIVIGYLLLALGLFIILASLYASYGIFVSGNAPPGVFSSVWGDSAPAELSGLEIEGLPEGEIPMDMIMGEIFPQEAISKGFNLFAWSLFVFIAIFGGSKIAGVGVKMVKS